MVYPDSNSYESKRRLLFDWSEVPSGQRLKERFIAVLRLFISLHGFGTQVPLVLIKMTMTLNNPSNERSLSCAAYGDINRYRQISYPLMETC